MRRRQDHRVDVLALEHRLEGRDVLDAVFGGEGGRAGADGHANESGVPRVVRQGVGVHAGHQTRTHDPVPDAHDALLVAAGGCPAGTIPRRGGGLSARASIRGARLGAGGGTRRG